MAQLTYLPRSDDWAVQMDGPKEDHNQKGKMGKRELRELEKKQLIKSEAFVACTAIQCLTLLHCHL